MRIGILTGGGDSPGLNACIRSIYFRAKEYGWKTIGIHDGWKGLTEKGKSKELTEEEVESIFDKGGTILGSSRTNPYNFPEGPKQVIKKFKENKLDALIAIGGEDTLGVAGKLFEDYKIPVVGVPKTIDHDVVGTEYTIGFDTAVNSATEVIDRLHTTAKSHKTVFIIEIMGRHAGWLTLRSGIAGGAHIILIPEKPYDLKKVFETIKKREKEGKYTLIAVSEGVDPPKQLNEKKDGFDHVLLTNRGLAYAFKELIDEECRIDSRVMVMGHMLRGGTPTAFDRVMASRVGSSAVDFIKEKKFGFMTAVQGGEIKPFPLKEVIEKYKTVSDQEYKLLQSLFEGDVM
ncbi:MAG: 6-phosphofructokinase [Candidatus Diapherotrites archaeon CG10_big_fil_rev_8_21_14_0_10_31_34]|nr:MAG: 6-phosphofructokinase [Candidatus Diapherotrites archaeon CG10_big_fil_rev_8_21_14_0_10_31_34]